MNSALNLRIDERPPNPQSNSGDDTPNDTLNRRDSSMDSNPIHQPSSIIHEVNIVESEHNGKLGSLGLSKAEVRHATNKANSNSLIRASNFSPFWTTENIARLLKYLEAHFEDYNTLKKNEFYRQAAASLGFTWQQVKNKLERLKKEYINSRLAQIAQHSTGLNGTHIGSVPSRPNLQFYDRLDMLFGHEVGLNGSSDNFGQSFFGTSLIDDLDSETEHSPISGLTGESPTISNTQKRRRTAEILHVNRGRSEERSESMLSTNSLKSTVNTNMYPHSISSHNPISKCQPEEARYTLEKRRITLEEENLRLEKRKLDWEEERLKLDKRKIDWEEQRLQLERRKIEWELESVRRRFELEGDVQIEDFRRRCAQ